jgi:hypothetical protein
MGLRDRLFGKRPSTFTVGATLYEGDDTLEVVGESYRQEVLWEIVGGRCDERVRFDTVALLVPEPTNEHDPNAIMVLIRGELVGYLSREDATMYLPGLRRLIERSEDGRVALNATIVGGGKDTDHRGRVAVTVFGGDKHTDRLGLLGVFLHHDPADFGI